MPMSNLNKNKKLFIFSLSGGLISGTMGILGYLGLCSTSFIAGLFAFIGLNSMILMTYNKIFLLFGLGFLILSVWVYRRNRNVCSPKQTTQRLSKREIMTMMGTIMITGILLAGRYFNSKLTASQNLEKRIVQLEEELRFLKAGVQPTSAPPSSSTLAQIRAATIPSGVPEIYGNALGISFDRVQEAINTVALFDPTYGSRKIVLTGQDFLRYKKIGSQIACEYCCGAKTLVFDNGEAACGCDHSQMMRGLAAYLIKNHPLEFNDEQILEQLKKWKAVFFPKQTLQAKFSEMEKTGEPGIKEFLKEFPDFLPSMVGGC